MANDVSYDPNVIQFFANKLYARARSVVLSCAFLGMLLGGGIAFGLAFATISPTLEAVIVGGLFGCLIGASIGNAKAFELKLKAQTALCQMHIENNTRIR